MEKIEEKIRQRFLDKSDCYTDMDVGGLAIPAMTSDAVLEIVTHFVTTRNDEVVNELEKFKEYFDEKVKNLKNALHPYDQGRFSGFEAGQKAFDDLLQTIK